VVGSQRYGFIYLMAFWVLFLAKPRSTVAALLRLSGLFIVLSGIGLTYSRTSIIALGVTLAAYGVWRLLQAEPWHGWTFSRVVRRLPALGLPVLAAAAVFPATIQFYGWHLVQFLMEDEADLGNPISSEGTRVVIWRSILEFVGHNPVTGSGFLGAWTLGIFDGGGGSAHNQYFDVLLRVGFIGFAIYVFLLHHIGRYLRRHHADLFWGFLGVLVYGAFHETFKESHGTFLLAFLIGMSWQTRIPSRALRSFFRRNHPEPGRLLQGTSSADIHPTAGTVARAVEA
jgi:O-antigen ligase